MRKGGRQENDLGRWWEISAEKAKQIHQYYESCQINKVNTNNIEAFLNDLVINIFYSVKSKYEDLVTITLDWLINNLLNFLNVNYSWSRKGSGYLQLYD